MSRDFDKRFNSTKMYRWVTNQHSVKHFHTDEVDLYVLCISLI